jgi:hypothetical protein
VKFSSSIIRRLRAGEPGSFGEEHPPTPAPEPEPPPPEPAPPAPEPQPPTPEPAEPVPQLRPPEPLPASQEPQEWNIWELERVANARAGGNGTRHEEIGFLLLELRQFANAEGRLPLSFDPVVRESFGDLVYASN